MKYLITGALGQLGKAFRKVLEGDAIFLSHKELDITDLHEVREALDHYKPDVVINCAAYNKVDDAEKDWREAYKVNGLGSRNLAVASNELGAILVHFSTDYVFDGKKEAPYTIADRPNPLSEYGKSKLLGEEFVRSLTTRHIIIRTSWVFGDGTQNFVHKVMSWSRKYKTLRIVVDEVSSPTYTEDLAKATVDLLKVGAFGLFHITNSESASRYEFAKEILNIVGWNGKVEKATQEDFKLLARRPKYSVLDNFALKESIGYNLRSWREALREFLKR